MGVQVQLQPVVAGSSDRLHRRPAAAASWPSSSPIPGSPAEAAGLLPGDVILAVDGKSLDGLSLDEISALIKGPRDTSVTLTIGRSWHAP